MVETIDLGHLAAKPKGSIRWTVEYPKTLPRPENILGNPLFEIVFKIRTTKQLPSQRLQVYIKSLSQGVVFVFPEELAPKRRRYLVFGKAKIQRFSLDSAIIQMTGGETEYVFSCTYRPMSALSDYVYSGSVSLEYYLQPLEREKVFGPYRIVIPFEGKLPKSQQRPSKP